MRFGFSLMLLMAVSSIVSFDYIDIDYSYRAKLFAGKTLDQLAFNVFDAII